jgi:cytochrome c-type biogenesis protein CcmH
MLTVAILILVMQVGIASAQDDEPALPTATYDEINEVASKMYCPICEMEPLDTCRAQTCIDWRAIIGERLSQGQTEEEIIDYFVLTYGDRVVGIPEDETLRFLSLVGPVLAFVIALVVGVMTFMRWRRADSVVEPAGVSDAGENELDYRTQVENDLYRQ